MKKSIQLNLTTEEKKALKLKKVPIKNLINYALDELAPLLDADEKRAMEIQALVEFQSIAVGSDKECLRVLRCRLSLPQIT